MKIYLDMCCFNRPFDDQGALSVRLETEAKLQVQSMVRAGAIQLGWSYALDLENAANPFPERRSEIHHWRAMATDNVEETPEILAFMRDAVSKGVKPLDALHLGCAVAMKCDVFFSVDKSLLRKAGQFQCPRIMNPVDYVMGREEET